MGTGGGARTVVFTETPSAASMFSAAKEASGGKGSKLLLSSTRESATGSVLSSGGHGVASRMHQETLKQVRSSAPPSTSVVKVIRAPGLATFRQQQSAQGAQGKGPRHATGHGGGGTVAVSRKQPSAATPRHQSIFTIPEWSVPDLLKVQVKACVSRV